MCGLLFYLLGSIYWKLRKDTFTVTDKQAKQNIASKRQVRVSRMLAFILGVCIITYFPMQVYVL